LRLTAGDLAFILLFETLELLLLAGSLAGLPQEGVRVRDVVLKRLHGVDLAGPQNRFGQMAQHGGVAATVLGHQEGAPQHLLQLSSHVYNGLARLGIFVALQAQM